MQTLFGRCALITGGASGIGRATVELLVQEGLCVMMADVDDARGQALAQELQELGARVLFIHCDVTRAEDCRRAVEEAIREFGRLDLLFNNAGIIRRADVVETTEEEWDRVMAVNCKSIFLMSKYAVPIMAQAGGGVIINMASGWGLRGGAQAAAYCASKGAVVNLTRAMALDHGAQNIRVNCICPGDTDTPMLHDEARQVGMPEAEFFADAAKRPLRRIAQPGEIAHAVLYLASDAAAFITGTALVIDGGALA